MYFVSGYLGDLYQVLFKLRFNFLRAGRVKVFFNRPLKRPLICYNAGSIRVVDCSFRLLCFAEAAALCSALSLSQR